MKKPMLVVMAAGMGSRYGGLKQLETVGQHGELLTDYSLYDAKKAGFEEVVFIINRRIEADFQQVIGKRLEKHMGVRYAYQEMDSFLPAGFMAHQTRQRPFGTGHAVLCAKDVVDAPFAVINADDYYGADAFSLIYGALNGTVPAAGVQQWYMVGYLLANTLTEHGHVARGVCDVAGGGILRDVVERLCVERRAGGAVCSEDGGKTLLPLPLNATVSMNLWGFTVPGIFGELETAWAYFLENTLRTDPEKKEFFLPGVVNDAIHAGRASVRVLRSSSHWHGVTYREDKPAVAAAIAEMVTVGEYPPVLWN